MTLIFCVINDAFRPVSLGRKSRIVVGIDNATTADSDRPGSLQFHRGELHASHLERTQGLKFLNDLPAIQSWHKMRLLDFDGSIRQCDH